MNNLPASYCLRTEGFDAGAAVEERFDLVVRELAVDIACAHVVYDGRIAIALS